MLERKITAFGNQMQTKNGLEISVVNTFNIIKSDALMPQIQDIRNTTDEKLQAEKKGKLPNVTWNGTFENRNSNGLKVYSGVTAIDIDLTPGQVDDLPQIKSLFLQDPSVLGMFRTPRWGIKLVYAHDNTDSTLHKDMYAQLVEHVKQSIGNSVYKIDTSCSDISRVNNLSWDPEIYVNPSPIPFHFDTTKVVKKTMNVKNVGNIANPSNYTYNGNIGDKTLEDIDRMTCNKYNMFEQGERHVGLVFFTYRCVEYGIGYQEALLWAIDKFCQPGFENEEIIKTINSIYK